MEILYKNELQSLNEKIINRYLVWCKEKEGFAVKEDLVFTTYLDSTTYKKLIISFNDLVKAKGVRKMNASMLRKILFYGPKQEQLRIQDEIHTVLKLYIESGKKEDKKYYTATLQEFTTAFEYWDEVDPGTYLEANLFKRVVKLLKYDELDRRKQVFFVLNAVHYGDRILVEMIKNNPNRKDLLSLLFDFVSNKGVREGWRAEYFLSEMEPTIVEPFLIEKEKGADAGLMEKIERIRTKGLLPYLKEIIARNESKKEYALQVLKQLEIDAMDNLG